MRYIVESYGSLCSLHVFKINGKNADDEDFVDQYDHCPGQAEPYGCGDMMATPIPHTEEVLKKYGITKKEYKEIANKVATELSFGNCGWCT